MHQRLLSHKAYQNDKYNNYGMYQAPYPMPTQGHIQKPINGRGNGGNFCPMDLNAQAQIESTQQQQIDPSVPSFAFSKNNQINNIIISNKAFQGQSQNNQQLQMVPQQNGSPFSINNGGLQQQEQQSQQQQQNNNIQYPNFSQPRQTQLENAAFPLREVNLGLTLNNEDQQTKILIKGPTEVRTATDTWILLIFGVNVISCLVIAIFGFVKCDPFEYDNTILGTTGFTLSSTLLMKGIPAVGAGIGASFGIGLLFQIFLMRFTFCFSMIMLFLILCGICTLAVLTFVWDWIYLGISFSVAAFIFLVVSFLLYQKLHAMDQVAKMAAQFSQEMNGQFCLLMTSLIVLVIEMALLFFGFYFLSSKLSLDGFTIIIDPLYQALSWVLVFNSLWLMSTTQQMYKFSVSYMCCKWYFSRVAGVGVMECLSVSFTHIGSLTMSSLLNLFLSYLHSTIWNTERFFRFVGLTSVADAFKPCRKSIGTLVSSLTVVRIAHEGSDFCTSSKSISKQLTNDPFYFLFVLWGADLISVFVEFVSFWSGMVTCVILLYYIEVGYNITFYILLLFAWIACSKVSNLMVQNFSMVLYSIGTYYNLCDNLFNKNSSEITNQIFFQMRNIIATATAATNIQAKDIS